MHVFNIDPSKFTQVQKKKQMLEIKSETLMAVLLHWDNYGFHPSVK